MTKVPMSAGRDLLFRAVLQRRLDAVGDRFDGRDADRPLLARLQQSLISFWRSNRSRVPSFFTTMYGNLVDPFVAGEPLAAFEALPPPPNHFAFPAFA